MQKVCNIVRLKKLIPVISHSGYVYGCHPSLRWVTISIPAG